MNIVNNIKNKLLDIFVGKLLYDHINNTYFRWSINTHLSSYLGSIHKYTWNDILKIVKPLGLKDNNDIECYSSIVYKNGIEGDEKLRSIHPKRIETIYKYRQILNNK